MVLLVIAIMAGRVVGALTNEAIPGAARGAGKASSTRRSARWILIPLCDLLDLASRASRCAATPTFAYSSLTCRSSRA